MTGVNATSSVTKGQWFPLNVTNLKYQAADFDLQSASDLVVNLVSSLGSKYSLSYNITAYNELSAVCDGSIPAGSYFLEITCTLESKSYRMRSPSAVVKITTATTPSTAQKTVVSGDDWELTADCEMKEGAAESYMALLEKTRKACADATTAANNAASQVGDAVAAATQAKALADEATESASAAASAANTAKTNVESTEKSVENAEAKRVTAESARATAESKRAEAETARANAESARSEAETTRETKENARNQLETARCQNEDTRQLNESSRRGDEASRISNETARQTAENKRADAESKRASAEETRASNENTRKSNESTRQTNETTRQSNEDARKKAESSRVEAESDRATAEQGRVSAEETRASNETARQKAETARAEAENAREAACTKVVNSANTAAANAKADYIGDDNYVYKWNSTKQTYEKSSVYAKGGQGIQGIKGDAGKDGSSFNVVFKYNGFTVDVLDYDTVKAATTNPTFEADFYQTGAAYNVAKAVMTSYDSDGSVLGSAITVTQADKITSDGGNLYLSKGCVAVEVKLYTNASDTTPVFTRSCTVIKYATTINTLIDKVAALEKRVAALEASSSTSSAS